MSLRALWVVSHDKGENGKVRFSKRYPTVEFRAKSLAGTQYVAVPEDRLIPQLLLTELGLLDPDKPYIATRDDCALQQHCPAVELCVGGPGGRTLWPLLTISQGGLILACLPLVEAPPEPRPPLPSLASVSRGLALLSGLQGFLCGTGGKLPEPDVLASRLANLPLVLLQVCPLGMPLDVPPQAGALPTAVALGPGGAQKQPAWKAGVHRGRAVVSVALTEMVRCMQYGTSSKQDMWDVYGKVMCKCEVEGILPNVTVTLTLPPNGSPLQDILIHPCVTSLDSSILTASSVDQNDGSAFSGPYKFPFSPPLEPFRLCSYTSQVPVPPILGSYQLREEVNLLKLNVVLKLHESVRNSFEYCEAQLPFFNRSEVPKVTRGYSGRHCKFLRTCPWTNRPSVYRPHCICKTLLPCTRFDFIWLLCGPALCTSVFLSKTTHHHNTRTGVLGILHLELHWRCTCVVRTHDTVTFMFFWSTKAFITLLN
uniref:AP-5 complex subunit mu-1 n=1 Tax=Astyanax mexicanus TaxID=7994 RepID=A0A8B9LU84_ASTMX